MTRHLIGFVSKGPETQQKGISDGDTKAYFEEVIRGSALFGLLPDAEGDSEDEDSDADDDNFRYSGALAGVSSESACSDAVSSMFL